MSTYIEVVYFDKSLFSLMVLKFTFPVVLAIHFYPQFYKIIFNGIIVMT